LGVRFWGKEAVFVGATIASFLQGEKSSRKGNPKKPMASGGKPGRIGNIEGSYLSTR